ARTPVRLPSQRRPGHQQRTLFHSPPPGRLQPSFISPSRRDTTRSSRRGTSRGQRQEHRCLAPALRCRALAPGAVPLTPPPRAWLWRNPGRFLSRWGWTSRVRRVGYTNVVANKTRPASLTQADRRLRYLFTLILSPRGEPAREGQDNPRAAGGRAAAAGDT